MSTQPKPNKARSGTDRPGGPAAPVPGVICADQLYLASEVCARLRWGSHAYRAARRAGLRPIRFGRQSYLLGSDVLEFFRRIADNQSGGDHETT